MLRPIIALAALLLVAGGPATQPALVFQDAAEPAGLGKALAGIMAHAAACGDIDGDGDLDLFVGGFCDRPPAEYAPADGPVPTVLLVNEGGKFRDAAQKDAVFQARTSGAVFADLDNDGDLDLYVTNNSKAKGLRLANRLLENLGGKFRDISAGNGACIIMGGRSVGVLDYDGDGLLDLLVASDEWTDQHTRLFRNLGKLAFEDVTAKVGLPDVLPGLGVVTPDLNGDGWPDIFVSQANRLFLSRGDGTYAEGDSKCLQYPRLGREDTPAGVTFGDLDRDGRLDLVMVDHNQPARVHVFRNVTAPGGPVRFEQVTKEAGLDYLFPQWGPGRVRLKHAHVQIADFDNDGWPDICIAATYRDASGEQPFICRNLGGLAPAGGGGGMPRFAVPPLDKATAYYPAGPVADFDADGRLDAMFASWWPTIPSKLFLNRTASGNHWLAVSVAGRTVNRMGIGAKVRVYRPGGLGRGDALLGSDEIHVSHGFCTGGPAAVHFGLATQAACDVEVILPHGKGTLRLPNTPADRAVVVKE